MEKRISAVKSYLNYAKAGDTNGCKSLVSDSIVLISERDGIHDGITNYENYITRTKFEGNWNEPTSNGNEIIVNGKVRRLGIDVKVYLKFYFNNIGKINRIEGRKR